MCINDFRLLFFHIQVVEYVGLNFSFNLCDIFFIATTVEDYIYNIWSLPVQISLGDKWIVPILEFKEFTLLDMFATKAIFFCILLFPMLVCQSKGSKDIKMFSNLVIVFPCQLICFLNVLHKMFEVWRFLYNIFLTFGITFGLLGMHVVTYRCQDIFTDFQFFIFKLFMGNCRSFCNSFSITIFVFFFSTFQTFF